MYVRVRKEKMTNYLVFKLDEIEYGREHKRPFIDTTLYILYDKKKGKYIIRGRRHRVNRDIRACTYSYEATHLSKIADFIQYVICKESKVNETLYSFVNFPENSDNITFDFLEDFIDVDYEISGYDSQALNREKMVSNLSLLKCE